MRRDERTVNRQRFRIALAAGYVGLVVPCLAAAASSPETETAAPNAAESRAVKQFKKGLSLAEAGQLDAAAGIFLRLTQEYPRLPQPYVQLAAVYQQQGNTQAAVEVLRKALDVHTDAGRLQEQLGDLYLQLAAEAYRAALEPETGHATATVRKKYTTLEALGAVHVER